jgi:hypothetical protein
MVAAPIYVTNQSTNVTDADAATMTSACNAQLAQHVAPAWGRLASPVVFVPRNQVPRGGWVIVLMDTLDEVDALGWHTDDGQGIHGVVGTKATLDAGYKVLTGTYAVATTLSHEVVELFLDVHCNVWCDTGRGQAIIQEACDPVEADHYKVQGVDVSDFVLPDYFDPTPTSKQFDYLGKLTKPFSLAKGGYYVYEAEGRSGQKFDEHVPQWRRELKSHPVARAGRALAQRAES